MKAYATLNKIREHSPCREGWEKLLKFLNKTKADDEPLAITTILESNGVEDAIWCLRALSGEWKKSMRLFAADCAESVLHVFEYKFPENDGPRKAIEAARDYAAGKIDENKLIEARIASGTAAATYDVAAAAYADAAYSANAAYAGAAYSANADYADADAAYAAEKEKQKKLLIKYFG